MLLPKITWNDGSAHTLNFVYPPVQKPGADTQHAERHDTITSSGVKQSVLERIDVFLTLQLNFVAAGGDLNAWLDFMTYALTGGKFTYYPDATVAGTHTDYTLEDTDFNPAFVVRGFFKFSMKMRKFV